MQTEEQIEVAKTPAGGWSRETLAARGMGWPSLKGRKAELIVKSKEQK